MTDYLTVADVLAIHEDLIARYGGASGVRDLGLLEAALFRPQTAALPRVRDVVPPSRDGRPADGYACPYSRAEE